MTGRIISCYYFTKVELENMEVYVLGIAFFFLPGTTVIRCIRRCNGKKKKKSAFMLALKCGRKFSSVAGSSPLFSIIEN